MPALKTYGNKRVQPTKKSTLPVSKACNVFDALLAKNVEKRNTSIKNEKKIVTRSRKKQIDNLPTGPTQLSDSDSLCFIANTTFDRLLHAPNYNTVKYGHVSSLFEDSSPESSYKNIKTSVKSKTNKKLNNPRKKVNNGKISKKKNEVRKLTKSVKVTIDSFSTNNKPVNKLSKAQNSYEKSINHSLIIENQPNKQANNYDLSKIIADDNKKYLNSSSARKYTPIVSSANLKPKRHTSFNKSDIFQNGFQHRMRAESTPKFMLSSTPISRKYLNVDDKIDVSPITARNNTKSYYNSRFLSYYDKSDNVRKSTNELLKTSIINSKNSKLEAITSIDDSKINCDTPIIKKRKIKKVNRYSPSCWGCPLLQKKKNAILSIQPLISSIITIDDSKIQYESLPHTSKSVSKIIETDIKFNAIPVVVLERYIDWPIQLNPPKVLSESFPKTDNSSDQIINNTNINLKNNRKYFSNGQNSQNLNMRNTQNYDGQISNSKYESFMSKHHPRVSLEQLSLKQLKKSFAQISTITNKFNTTENDFSVNYFPKLVLENLSFSRLNGHAKHVTMCSQRGSKNLEIGNESKVLRKRFLQKQKLRLINFKKSCDRSTNTSDLNITNTQLKCSYSPKVVLENLSLSYLNDCARTTNKRSQRGCIENHSTVPEESVERSKSVANLSSITLFSSEDESVEDIFDISDQDSDYVEDTETDNSENPSSNIIENSRNSNISKHIYVTTRRLGRVNTLTTKESSPKLLSATVAEFERFTKDKISKLRIDSPDTRSETNSSQIEINEQSSHSSSRSSSIVLANEFEQFAQNNIGNIQIHCSDTNNTTKSSKLQDIEYENNEKRTSAKSAIHNTSCDIIEINDITRVSDNINSRSKTYKGSAESSTFISQNLDNRKSIFLRPGKQWFRSLSILRHSDINNAALLASSNNKGRKYRESVYDIFEQQANRSSLNTIINDSEIQNLKSKKRSSIIRHSSFKIVPIASTTSYNSLLNFETSATSLHNSGYVSTLANESILESFDKLSLTADVDDREQTARQIILKRCGQTTPILFDECYTQRTLKKCRKIGEGVYGEVFMYSTLDDKCRVMKIIPIEGSLVVNGEHQKKFEEIISEIIIASELSNLRTNTTFGTDGFAELLKICCVQGKYPQQLLDLWDLYDEHRGSENDSPEIFPDDQLYIILELANGGQDLEAYRFNNADQTYALFTQVVCSLAVAESALEFEHRDMHWGNILISPTDEPTTTFRLNNREFEVATKGVKLSIIDYTLSRMTFNKCFIFNDLGLDPDLFTATGDYQFEIYRLMRNHNQNDWQRFEPFSNILWLDYTLEKMIGHLRYLRVTTKAHKTGIRRLSQLRKKVLSYNSATEFLNSDVFSHVFL